MDNIISFIKQFELKNVSVQTLYQAMCMRLDTRINKQVMRILSPVPGDYDVMDEINISKNYIGDKGVQALLPVIYCCPKIAELDLSHNGITDETGVVLTQILKSVPSLTTLSLANNDVGTPTAKALLGLLKTHTVLKQVNLENTLVVTPLRAKIYRQAESNNGRAGSAAVTPISKLFGGLRPQTKSTPSTAGGGGGKFSGSSGSMTSFLTLATAKPQDPSGGITFADLDLLDEYAATAETTPQNLPPQWLYDCFLEFATLLFKHRYHIRDVFGLFPYDTYGRTALPDFVRGLRILGAVVPFKGVSDEVTVTRVTAMATVMDCYRDEMVQVRDMVHKLRVHIWLLPPNTDVPLTSLNINMQTLIDAIYDMKNVLNEAFEAIDPNHSGTLNCVDIMEGLTALVVEGALGVVDTKTKQQSIVDLFNVMEWKDEIGTSQFFDAFVVSDDPERHLWYTANKELRNMERHLGTNGRRESRSH